MYSFHEGTLSEVIPTIFTAFSFLYHILEKKLREHFVVVVVLPLISTSALF